MLRAVATFDVFDAATGGKSNLLGRIYLDMHPREGKDKWFSSSPIVPGIRGKQLPEGMLVCNFSGGAESGDISRVLGARSKRRPWQGHEKRAKHADFPKSGWPLARLS